MKKFKRRPIGRTLSAKMLMRAHACDVVVEAFRLQFGEQVYVTRRLIEEQIRDRTEWSSRGAWLARHMLTKRTQKRLGVGKHTCTYSVRVCRRCSFLNAGFAAGLRKWFRAFVAEKRA